MRRLALAALLCSTLAAPAAAQLAALNDLPAALANASVPILILTNATTQLVAAPTAPAAIYVTAVDVVGTGTGNIQFVFGTGVNCATGQGNVSGNYHLAAQSGLSKGAGLGPVWVLPAGTALCAVTSAAAVEIDGSLAYRIH